MPPMTARARLVLTRRIDMTTIPHEAPVVRRQVPALFVRDMWPSLTIIAMWLAVLFDAIYGPDIVSTTVTTTSHVPSAVVLALFAFFATWVVAKYGFRRAGDS
jgi:hypothetical protein